MCRFHRRKICYPDDENRRFTLNVEPVYQTTRIRTQDTAVLLFTAVRRNALKYSNT